jgi:hypothetical protein
VIAASVRERPFLWLFLTQTESAFSISGNLPLARFTGDKLRSSGNRYFSLWRRTFETVLKEKLVRVRSINYYSKDNTFARHRTLLQEG